jgi:hypothetical protein
VSGDDHVPRSVPDDQGEAAAQVGERTLAVPGVQTPDEGGLVECCLAVDLPLQLPTIGEEAGERRRKSVLDGDAENLGRGPRIPSVCLEAPRSASFCRRVGEPALP